jgi:hypothetical protein
MNSQLSVTLSWPSPSTGFTLQQISDLANTNGWTAYGGALTANGTTKYATVPAGPGNMFYRLRKP